MPDSMMTPEQLAAEDAMQAANAAALRAADEYLAAGAAADAARATWVSAVETLARASTRFVEATGAARAAAQGS